MKCKLVLAALLGACLAVTAGCSRQLQPVVESETPVISVSEIETTTEEITEAVTQEETTVFVPQTLIIIATDEATVPATTTTGLSNDESGLQITYDGEEYIRITPPDSYYPYNTEMKNFVTLMSDKTNDFFTIVDLGKSVIPSSIQESMNAELIGDGFYRTSQEKGVDLYYFTENGYAVKISYSSYDEEYTGMIKGKSVTEYLMDMAKGFEYGIEE